MVIIWLLSLLWWLQGYYRKGEIECAAEHYKEAIESYQVCEQYLLSNHINMSMRFLLLLLSKSLLCDSTGSSRCTMRLIQVYNESTGSSRCTMRLIQVYNETHPGVQWKHWLIQVYNESTGSSRCMMRLIQVYNETHPGVQWKHWLIQVYNETHTGVRWDSSRCTMKALTHPGVQWDSYRCTMRLFTGVRWDSPRCTMRSYLDDHIQVYNSWLLLLALKCV